MRRQFVAGVVIIGIGLLGAVPGCSRKPDPAAATPGTTPPAAATAPAMGSQVASQIGLGQLSGHTYTHDHFKLAVTLPEEWYIQKKSESDQLMEAGKSLTKQDANTQAVMQSAQQRTLALLSAFRHPPGTPVPFNESVIMLAENVAVLPGLKLGEDYLKLMQKSMAGMTLKYEFEPIESDFKIGSHPAGRLRVHLHVADKQIEQEYYAARVGDYFLVVILSYGDDEQQAAVRSILESLKAD
jgi:hypothetical protein